MSIHQRMRSVTIHDIFDAARIVTGTQKAELIGRKKTRPVVLHRQAAMAAAYQLTGRSLPSVARAFGRDHTTVLHAVRTVETDDERQAIRDEIVGMLISAFAHDWVGAVPFKTRRQK